jgi:hypothetical protein
MCHHIGAGLRIDNAAKGFQYLVCRYRGHCFANHFLPLKRSIAAPSKGGDG